MMDAVARGLAAKAMGLVPSAVGGRAQAVLLGDSVSGQAGGTSGNTSYQSRNWLMVANAILGWPLDIVANLGVSGETSAQILARVSSAVAYNAGVYTYQSGINDLSQGVDVNITIANQAATLRALAANGALVVLLTTHAVGAIDTSATQLAAYGTLLNWQRTVAPTIPGVIVADVARSMQDIATGLSATGFLNTDTIHLTAQASWKAYGPCLAQALAPYFPMPRPASSIRDYHLYSVPNPGMSGNNATGSTGTVLGTGVTGNAPDGAWVEILAGGAVVCATAAASTTDWRPERTLTCSTTCTSDNDGVAFRFGSQAASSTQYQSTWAATQALAKHQRKRPTVSNGFTYRVIKGGTTGSTEPVWPTTEGQYIADGTVTYITQRMPAAGDTFIAVAEFTIANLTAGKWAIPYVRLTPTSNGQAVGDKYAGLYTSASDGQAPINLGGRFTLVTPPVTLTTLPSTFDSMPASLQCIGQAGASFDLKVSRAEILRIS